MSESETITMVTINKDFIGQAGDTLIVKNGIIIGFLTDTDNRLLSNVNSNSVNCNWAIDSVPRKEPEPISEPSKFTSDLITQLQEFANHVQNKSDENLNDLGGFFSIGQYIANEIRARINLCGR